MTEKAFLWTTGATGDGASTYTQAEAFGIFRRMFVTTPATQGVLKGFEGDLAVTGTSSPISVAKGAAIVYGCPYLSDAATSVAVTTPSVGTTGHRVVLQMGWAAQTVRIALKSSADGTATIPDVTQEVNTTWEISLASLTITTGGVISVTDTRAYCQPLGVMKTANIADSAVTAAKIADSAVTADKIAADSAILCRVYRSTAQNITSTTWTALSFDTEVYDTDGCWSSAQPTRLIAKRAGYYLVGGAVTFDTTVVTESDKRVSVYIRSNGSVVESPGGTVHTVSGKWASTTETVLVHLDVDEYVEIMAQHDMTGTKATSASRAWTQGWMVRQS